MDCVVIASGLPMGCTVDTDLVVMTWPWTGCRSNRRRRCRVADGSRCRKSSMDLEEKGENRMDIPESITWELIKPPAGGRTALPPWPYDSMDHVGVSASPPN
uniref:Uncharacterized protein n=1 Tax=Oryza meridionalis TaxID=40149 RepID=A0A0E0ECA6_9ORYZ